MWYNTTPGSSRWACNCFPGTYWRTNKLLLKKRNTACLGGKRISKIFNWWQIIINFLDISCLNCASTTLSQISSQTTKITVLCYTPVCHRKGHMLWHAVFITTVTYLKAASNWISIDINWGTKETDGYDRVPNKTSSILHHVTTLERLFETL